MSVEIIVVHTGYAGTQVFCSVPATVRHVHVNPNDVAADEHHVLLRGERAVVGPSAVAQSPEAFVSLKYDLFTAKPVVTPEWTTLEIEGVTVRRGWKLYADGEACTAWAVIPVRPEFDDDMYWNIAERADIGQMGYYGGPGRPFADGAWMQRTNTRVLITQRRGLDV